MLEFSLDFMRLISLAPATLKQANNRLRFYKTKKPLIATEMDSDKKKKSFLFKGDLMLYNFITTFNNAACSGMIRPVGE